MADHEDKDLMNDLLLGKESAFKEIYDRYFEKLFVSCFGIVHHTQEAEDIVIITFNKLFERHANFQSIGQMQAWLFLAARNNCIDTLRRRKVLLSTLEKADNTNLPSVEDQSINDELDALLLDRLFQLIEELPKQSRQVIRLKYMEGLKYKDIAEKLDVSPRTVENLLRYALDRLRNTLINKKLLVTILAILNFH